MFHEIPILTRDLSTSCTCSEQSNELPGTISATSQTFRTVPGTGDVGYGKLTTRRHKLQMCEHNNGLVINKQKFMQDTHKTLFQNTPDKKTVSLV